MGSEAALELVDKCVALRQLGRGDVDCEPGLPRQLALPGACLRKGALERPLADRADQARVFGERHELLGSEQPAQRVLPADQRLRPDDLSASTWLPLHDRLPMEQELAARQRGAQADAAMYSAKEAGGAARTPSAGWKKRNAAPPASFAEYMAASA